MYKQKFVNLLNPMFQVVDVRIYKLQSNRFTHSNEAVSLLVYKNQIVLYIHVQVERALIFLTYYSNDHGNHRLKRKIDRKQTPFQFTA